MTSQKQIILGFLFIALGFGFLMLGFSALVISTVTPPANLFFSYPPTGHVVEYLTNVANVTRAEQAVGMICLLLGFAIGVAGCFRKDKPTLP